MSDTPPKPDGDPARINLHEVIAHSEWSKDPEVGFDQLASLTIARWVLYIFAGVYALGFVATFGLLFKADATFEKGSELVKFLIQSLIPLVTLAVGYYLGDRSRQQASRE